MSECLGEGITRESSNYKACSQKRPHTSGHHNWDDGPYYGRRFDCLEKIFALPGIGWLLVDVIGQRDYTMLSGINLFIASFVLATNIIVDMTYAYLDPGFVINKKCEK